MNDRREGAGRKRGADTRLSFLGELSADQIDPMAVGAKAAGLFAMADAGLPVPPGFVLGTRVCADYYERGGQLGPEVAGLIERGIGFIERSAGRRFGSDRRPLLVSVRSGAPVSMPGMLDTMLNIGLCDRTLEGLLRETGDPVFVWDSYRRLIGAYAEIAEGQPAGAFSVPVERALRRHEVPAASELDVAALREVVAELLGEFRTRVGHPFPQDPHEQLTGAVTAVLRSWNSARAAEYRRLEGVTGLPGTAVTVQLMVFGNVGVSSGSGVGFTRDPVTGENRPLIDFLLGAQGEDVVAGGLSASPGVASGRIALDVETALRQADRGEDVILVRDQASTDDIAALGVCAALLTGRGARTSHAAVVARQLGVVCLVGCPGLRIDPRARKSSSAAPWSPRGMRLGIDLI